jgi:hypothetical protein
VKPAPTNWFFWICPWGAGFLYCWFMAEMVGETRPYKLVLLDLSLGGRVFYIVGLWQRWLVKPAPTNRFFWICPWGGGFFILLVYGRDGWWNPPLQIGSFGFVLGGAGFLYCWFMAEMVGKTRPYKSIDIILEDDRLYIRFAIPFDRQRTRFINFD